MKRWLAVTCTVLATWALARAEDGGLVKKEWTVGGLSREALVHVPPAATTTETPVLLAFHGHGGTARHAASKWRYEELWPEAIVVYPQGLATVTRRDPDGKQPGWQNAADKENRDLKLVDAILESLAKDFKLGRVFATGHSNGGGFVYLLWAERGDRFAAFAPAAAVAGAKVPHMKPHPAVHVAGRQDPIVPFANQERTMRDVRALDECEDEGKPWGKGKLYASKRGAPFLEYVHEGGHELPDDAVALIAKFFKELPR